MKKMLLSGIFLVVGFLLLHKMHHSQITGISIYDYDLGVYLNPYHFGIQLSVLYGMVGMMVLAMAGNILLNGRYGVQMGVVAFGIYDLFMYPSIPKSSQLYAMHVWDTDMLLVWTICDISSLVLIVAVICLIVLVFISIWMQKEVLKKSVDVHALVLILFVFADLIFKAFSNPWYIWCGALAFVATLFLLGVFRRLIKKGEVA